ncbi:uncharacterized protein [Ptychodera flava]|uniref:uncharacterized protein n=1 Tax=Ptychodera flava TaxID=63121 RepID=UPI00396A608C
MPIMYSCGCCSLKAGNMICSVLILIEMVINLILYVFGVLQLLIDKPTLRNDVYIGMEVAFYILIGLFAIVMVCTSLYFCGAVKNHSGLLVGWIVTLILYMILELAGMVYICYVYHTYMGGLDYSIYSLGIIIWYLVRTLLHILYLLCAVSQYQEVASRERKIRRHQLIERDAERRF